MPRRRLIVKLAASPISRSDVTGRATRRTPAGWVPRHSQVKQNSASCDFPGSKDLSGYAGTGSPTATLRYSANVVQPSRTKAVDSIKHQALLHSWRQYDSFRARRESPPALPSGGTSSTPTLPFLPQVFWRHDDV